MTDFDFDAWLDGLSPATVSVDILQHPALLADYEEWQRRYSRAKANDSGEYAVGERNPVKALEVEGEALLARIEQSRSTWYVRGLSDDDRKAIVAAFPDPPSIDVFDEQPPRLAFGATPTEAQAKAYSQGYDAYKARQARWVNDNRDALEVYGEKVRTVATQRTIESIRRAVARVEQGGRTIAEALTYDQVEKLVARIGEAQAVVLTEAINRAANEVPEVPAGPLSHGSGGDPE